VHTIDLNADVGECGPEIDDAIIPLLTSANIACGAHAGDSESMAHAVEVAVRHGVALGAHPGYRDREHFGRRPMNLADDAVIELVRSQVEALAGVAAQQGRTLSHVKPHGALYNQAEKDAHLAALLVRAVQSSARPLCLYGRAGSAMERAARAARIPFAAEAFADRRYRKDGSLKPRSEAGSVLEDEEAVLAQVRLLVTQGEVEADDGSAVPVTFSTLCLHSDTMGAARLASSIRQELKRLRIRIQPLAAPG
jgi:UPF0271 protein